MNLVITEKKGGVSIIWVGFDGGAEAMESFYGKGKRVEGHPWQKREALNSMSP